MKASTKEFLMDKAEEYAGYFFNISGTIENYASLTITPKTALGRSIQLLAIPFCWVAIFCIFILFCCAEVILAIMVLFVNVFRHIKNGKIWFLL